MMRHWVVWLSIFLVARIMVATSSKILMIPVGFDSHILIYTKLGKALHDNGHEVWVLTEDTFKKYVEDKGLNPLTYPLQPENDLIGEMGKWFIDMPDGEGVWEKYEASEYWLMSSSRVCDSVFQNTHVMSTIRKQNFDLVVLDNLGLTLCFLMIPYIFDIPFISVYGFQSTGWVVGVTGMPSIEPEVIAQLSNKMNFWERIHNLNAWLDHYNDMYSDLFSDHHMNNYCPAHKPKITFKELNKKAEINLMNYEIMCLDYPRVSAPNMQYIGGSTTIPAEPLPEEFEAFLAGADHGVVIMTIGSWKPIHQVWRVIGEKLFEAFGRLPQKVIIQYRLDTIYGKVPANVKLVNWMPQNDLLGHPKTKLFVTHGGNNGQNEAAYHGVPMLVIPIINDNFYCGLRAEVHGYGKYVKDKKAATSDELFEMMTEVINNRSYTDNIKKCSAIIRSMPSTHDRFVFWVNHVLQFGGAHLRPPSLDMPLYQVLMLDIFAYYVAMLLAAVHAIILLLYFVAKNLRRYVKQKEE